MSKDYCLLDEPWLPVRLADGRVRALGLLEVFARSGEIVALADTAPPNLVAQYRLLLAITHRALAAQGAWSTGERASWYREGLPLEVIRAYLEQWRERFWLFHPQYPFMQVAALASCDETQVLFPSNTISLEQFYGTGMFNQEIYSTDSWLPQTVIRSLLGYLQFVPGGFFPGKKLKTSEKGGALVNTAALIPVGPTLAQTLCLALHPAAREGDEPDLPSWEHEPPSIAALRGEPVLASGPNDRYTRLSRAVLLCREAEGSIRWLHFAAGLALGEDPNAPDPMASFREGSAGPVRLTFGDGRALWRDLPALLPEAGGTSRAAAVMQYAVSLHAEMNPFDPPHQPLLVAGLASDQAKLLRWRMEQLVLPGRLLLEPQKTQVLRDAVAAAETLFFDLKRLATGLLADTLPDPASKDTRARARSLVESGPLATSYFATAERGLALLLAGLDAGRLEQAHAEWMSTCRRAAECAWDHQLAGLGRSPRAVRADARYWPRFRALLNTQAPRPEPVATDKEAVS
ncbi:type I-E CRISPR-associated protein Cse1/CasA [Pseudomonas otitidis]|uniref:Type I-E CRISPR-associated protein Cse1/CasA n=1 Tax=Metapseudomonas otitidis TaxID=319939 RepID=A0ABU3XN82_9GAMM|nr:type I-E CRISPR-associated protein Cse1/CasA [Pseudomonas otitidis]MDV3438787.1 type I-E CRISPR-associated protein Cse1/CasA [Pseudomonas otitidis]MDV3438850.1 type I-E CRISPR-associated protein Cse1/CasA [Pseudomonas otitidis]WMR32054.1 type I-E CRISPR-associated protein Cse1/CasA [Pseudomonas otitidis]